MGVGSGELEADRDEVNIGRELVFEAHKYYVASILGNKTGVMTL